MKKYKVYFELFGKKMRTVVEAESEWYAKDEICDSIIFHKVELIDGVNDTVNDVVNDVNVKNFADLLGIKL